MRGNSFPARIPPSNLDAEQAILGAMLLEGRVGVQRVKASGVQTADFYLEAHRHVWDACGMLDAGEREIDVVTVAEVLRRRGQLEAVGGPAKLAALVEQAAILAHLDDYGGVVVDLGKHRELIGLGTRIAAAGYDAQRPATEVLVELDRALTGLRERERGREFDPAESWNRTVDSWGKNLVRFGLEPLDAIAGGAAEGEVVVWGGLSGHGKTSITLDRALYLARSGVPVEVIALEESEDAVVRRLVAAASGVSVQALRTGYCGPEEIARAREATEDLQALPLRITGLSRDDDDSLHSAVAMSQARVVWIDHMQKVQYRERGRNDLRTYAVQRLVDRLHRVAIRDRKILCLNAQLTGDAEQRMLTSKHPRPQLGDIAESAAFRRAARQVYLLLWPWKLGVRRPKSVLEDEYDPSVYWIVVAKNSEGATGRAEVSYEAATGRFTAPTERLGE